MQPWERGRRCSRGSGDADAAVGTGTPMQPWERGRRCSRGSGDADAAVRTLGDADAAVGTGTQMPIGDFPFTAEALTMDETSRDRPKNPVKQPEERTTNPRGENDEDF